MNAAGAGGGRGGGAGPGVGAGGVTASAASTGGNDRRNRQKSLGGKSASIPDRVTLGAYTLDPFYTDFVGQSLIKLYIYHEI